MNIENLKRIMSEKERLDCHYWETKTREQSRQKLKKIKIKINELITNISTNSITKWNEQIYAGAKLVCEKIGLRQNKTNRNSKPGWEIRLETQIRNLRQLATNDTTGRHFVEGVFNPSAGDRCSTYFKLRQHSFRFFNWLS